MQTYNRIFAKIDLDAIHYNLKSIVQKLSPDTKILAVIKTDGYGHGAVEIAHELEPSSKVAGFAAATAEEALSLRRHGIRKPILILGYTFEEDYPKLITQQIRFTVYTYQMAKALSIAALKAGQKAYIHIKTDTGMGRIGYQVTEAAADEIAKIQTLPGIVTEGIFTHFARADEADKTHTKAQLDEYHKMLSMLKARNVQIPIKHVSNSAGIAQFPDAGFDLVRAGIILYGLYPSDEVGKDAISLKPVMQLKSKIIHIKELEAGRCISYGGTYCLAGARMIATVPVGYGDGYPRSLSGRGYVLIHGKKAPILGRICMDQFMVDITDIKDARLLDTVTLLGEDGGSVLCMEELAALSGRFNYEFACDISKRVPRVFYKGGKPVLSRDFFEI